MLVTVLCSVIASSGFWAYVQKRNETKDVKAEMLVGLGHDRIVYLGLHYLERKDENGDSYITRDEYENLHDYLYVPYKKLGGDGSAERVMNDVMKLPIRSS
jgi:hypothetical protein